MPGTFVFTVGIAFLIIIFVMLFLLLFPLGYGLRLTFQGLKLVLVPNRDEIKKGSAIRIVNPLIKATKAGLSIGVDKLEAHYLAGGNVNTLVDALIAAQRANIPWNLKGLLL